MDLRIILVLHLCIDVALCAVILGLLRKVAVLARNKEQDVTGTNDTVSISVKSAPVSFEETLDTTLTESRPEKKNSVPTEKMRKSGSGRGWMGRMLQFLPGRDASQNSLPSDRYRAAVDLASHGMPLERIAAELGLTEGEISLVRDLDRTRNESL